MAECRGKTGLGSVSDARTRALCPLPHPASEQDQDEGERRRHPPEDPT